MGETDPADLALINALWDAVNLRPIERADDVAYHIARARRCAASCECVGSMCSADRRKTRARPSSHCKCSAAPVLHALTRAGSRSTIPFAGAWCPVEKKEDPHDEECSSASSSPSPRKN
jgi:hypothetical protein